MAASSSQDLPLAANHHPAAHDHGHNNSPQPPPLPPRNPPSTGIYSARPDPSLMAMISKDPRSSSQQSLGLESDQESSGRRRLLLVFIHGFLGDETSFRSFPAHLHNLTAITFAETHVVRTKIYPKYRSRYSLDVARDAFSNWLTPHEDQFTDIVLLSHSMGGLVAADIALLFRHNIIGIINFDVPFVGMHPGIIKAGLGSIFKPWPTPEENLIAEAENSTDISSGTGKKPSRMSTLFNPKPTDPNYNPSFYNDVHLPVRKGWENTLHWMHKHSNGIIKASRDLVKSHIDFGGAMADYKTLKARYARIRALEEDDENQRRSANPEVRHPPRIRFVNYYTTSTGRPKKQKTAKSPSPSRPGSRGGDSSIGAVASLSQASLALQTPTTIDANISPNVTFEVEEHRGDQVVPVPVEAPLSATTPNAKPLERSPFFEKEQEQQAPSLPEVPPIPQEPPFVDLAEFTDKAQRKAAEKEHDQALDEYRKAVKARNKVINERSKILEKWEKQKQKDQLQVQKLQESELQQLQQRPQNPKETKSEVMPDTIVADSANDSDSLDEDFGAMQLGTTGSRAPPGYHTPYRSYTFSQSIIMNQSEPDEHASLHSAGHSSFTDSTYTLETVPSQSNSDPEAPPKKKRLRKFCMLPPKDAYGNKDPTWVQVFMEDVDEVAAHTTLFFMGDTYERLVGDVAARIEDWVREAESIRLVRDLEGM